MLVLFLAQCLTTYNPDAIFKFNIADGYRLKEFGRVFGLQMVTRLSIGP
jgi:hypothetical protein